jgi:GalNAc5-diNAcBac-PP-undecaprenol beta-1,3-glucosyltransferase
VSPRFTVVVPTFDHGPTLERSVPSALGQTVGDIEVFVVGDGASDVTREIMARLSAADARVRFFDNPKGPGNGEIHRAAALREASGDLIAYLADDDLWMPDHLEVLGTLLQDADFAHTYPIRVETDGSIGEWTVDLARPWYREAMLEGTNFVPLGCAGHTMGLYRRLPHGWRTKPEGTWSDLSMWQQILSLPGLRAASGTRPTVIHLPSSVRRGWPADRRLRELDGWVRRMAEPNWREDLYAAVLSRSWAGHTSAWQALHEHRRALEDLRAAEAAHREWEAGLLDQLRRQGHDRDEERRSLQGQLSALRRELRSRDSELAAIRATRTWRWRERVLRLPLLRSLAGRRGRSRSRPGAP